MCSFKIYHIRGVQEHGLFYEVRKYNEYDLYHKKKNIYIVTHKEIIIIKNKIIIIRKKQKKENVAIVYYRYFKPLLSSTSPT